MRDVLSRRLLAASRAPHCFAMSADCHEVSSFVHLFTARHQAIERIRSEESSIAQPGKCSTRRGLESKSHLAVGVISSG